MTIKALDLELKSWLELPEGIIGLGVKELKSGREFYHNPDVVFPAASIIKIPILIALYRELEAGKLNLEDQVVLKEEKKVKGAGVLQFMNAGKAFSLRELAWLMTVISDNTATNLIIDQLGMKKINRFLKSQGFKQTCLKRRLMIHPRTKIVKNFITARETTELLYRLKKGKLLSRTLSREVIQILSKQHFREKIPRYLPVLVANKTGDIRGISHDAGLVFLPGNPYVLTVLVKYPYEAKAGDLIAEIAGKVFDFLKKEKLKRERKSKAGC